MRLLPLLLLAGIGTAGAAFAQEPPAKNRYDVFAQAILPMVQTFAPDNVQHALRLEGRLLSMTNQPDAIKSARVVLATQYPDQLRVEITLNGEIYTLVRTGQKVWITPGAKAEALIKAIPKLPKLHADYELPPMQLPFDLKQLVLLPILFQITDAGEITVGGETSRVLDVTLMPELARGLKLQEWAARLWLHANGTPAQLRLTHDDWQVTIAIDKAQTGATFPPETWQPTKEQAADLLELSAPQVKQLLDAAGKQVPGVEKPKP